jgi:hypothetical protein
VFHVMATFPKPFGIHQPRVCVCATSQALVAEEHKFSKTNLGKL